MNDDDNIDENHVIECDVVRAVDKGTWLGVIAAVDSESIAERQSFVCGYPFSVSPLKNPWTVYYNVVGKKVICLTQLEICKVKLHNLFWEYFTCCFSHHLICDSEIKAVRERLINDGFDVLNMIESLVGGRVIVDYSRSPIEKNYGDLKRIVYLDPARLRKFIDGVSKPVIEEKEKPSKKLKVSKRLESKVEKFLNDFI